ncbi:MAG: hypothetical protein M1499_00875 [Firmicutes bacterium]|nr:hypothetical protein [Bacillota bacterium]
MDLTNLVGMIEQTVRGHPSHVAQIYTVEGEWRHRTYRQLWQTHIAFALIAGGTQIGDRVAISSRTRPRMGYC